MKETKCIEILVYYFVLIWKIFSQLKYWYEPSHLNELDDYL